MSTKGAGKDVLAAILAATGVVYIASKLGVKRKKDDSTRTSSRDVELKVAGLKNLGNTCFMNAILQSLASSKSFVEYLEQIVANLVESKSDMPFTSALWRFIHQLSEVSVGKTSSSLKALNPSDFEKQLRKASKQFARLGDQQDSDEFFHVLLDVVEKEIKQQEQVKHRSRGDSTTLCGLNALVDPDDMSVDSESSRESDYVDDMDVEEVRAEGAGSVRAEGAGSVRLEGAGSVRLEGPGSLQADGSKPAGRHTGIATENVGGFSNLDKIGHTDTTVENETTSPQPMNALPETSSDLTRPAPAVNGPGDLGTNHTKATPYEDALSLHSKGDRKGLGANDADQKLENAATESTGSSDTNQQTKFDRAPAPTNGNNDTNSTNPPAPSTETSSRWRLKKKLSRRISSAKMRKKSRHDGSFPPTLDTEGDGSCIVVPARTPREGFSLARIASMYSPLVKSPLEGSFLNQLSCERCLIKSPLSSSPYSVLSLSMVEYSQATPRVFRSLYQCLDAFTAPETVEDVECKYCKKIDGKSRQRARKRMMLGRLPKVLSVHIQRRHFDMRLQRMVKLNQHVEFPLLLNLYPYCFNNCLHDDSIMSRRPPQTRFKSMDGGILPTTTDALLDSILKPVDVPMLQQTKKTHASRLGSGRRQTIVPESINTQSMQVLYALVAVVVHHGSSEGGHFTAYRRVLAADVKSQKDALPTMQQWVHTSDSLVRSASLEEVLRAPAYMVFYERLTS